MENREARYMMQATKLPSIGLLFLSAVLLPLIGSAARAAEDGWTTLGPEDNFAAWRQSEGWYVAGDATVDLYNERHLLGDRGDGVLVNGRIGRARSLVTKQSFRDLEVHLEFMLAKGSNSGVIFHGNYEIQILDSHHVEKPTAAHCGGIYPRAETKPKYHYIDKGSPPLVNAAKPPGQWQTLDIIFQSPRFAAGKKTAHARFVKVVLNGQVIQENQEVPYACGTDWDRKQFPQGPIILQGERGPVAFRNVRVRPWSGGERQLNVPPPGFTAHPSMHARGVRTDSVPAQMRPRRRESHATSVAPQRRDCPLRWGEHCTHRRGGPARASKHDIDLIPPSFIPSPAGFISSPARSPRGAASAPALEGHRDALGVAGRHQQVALRVLHVRRDGPADV